MFGIKQEKHLAKNKQEVKLQHNPNLNIQINDPSNTKWLFYPNFLCLPFIIHLLNRTVLDRYSRHSVIYGMQKDNTDGIESALVFMCW